MSKVREQDISLDYIHCSNYHIKQDTELVVVSVTKVNENLKQLVLEVRELKAKMKDKKL